MCEICNASYFHVDENEREIVLTCLIKIFKESSVLYFFVESFIMFIFSVLVS